MKMINLIKIVPFAAMVVLAGCKDEPVRDVNYYLEHKEERDEKLAECNNDPGRLMHMPNCVNADKAAMKALFDSKKQGMPRF